MTDRKSLSPEQEARARHLAARMLRIARDHRRRDDSAYVLLSDAADLCAVQCAANLRRDYYSDAGAWARAWELLDESTDRLIDRRRSDLAARRAGGAR